jgi:acyl-CoA thioester hydrolase
VNAPVRFTRAFIALPDHIDELGHVNNTVWVGWAQELATSHWEAAARAEDREAFYWVVVRHEIDYRGNISAGTSVTGATWIPGEPQGATSLRAFEFTNPAGKVLVSGRTTWAMLDRATNRLVRVRPEVIAPFQTVCS